MSHVFEWTTTSERRLSFTYEDMFRARRFSVIEGNNSFIVTIKISEEIFKRASYLARGSKVKGLWEDDRIWHDVGHIKLLLELEEGLNEDSEFLITPESLKMDVPRMKKYRDRIFDEMREDMILALLGV